MREVAERAVAHYGVEGQCRKAIEELAEAIVEISHFAEGRIGVEDRVLEELADVSVMIDQILVILEERPSSFEARVGQKWAQLEQRLRATTAQLEQHRAATAQFEQQARAAAVSMK